MFTHIVFFKFNEPKAQHAEAGKKLLLAMEGKIPQLRQLEVGADLLHTGRSYDLALITRFDNQKDMDTYQVHPYHVNEVLAKLKPMLKDSAAVDYEI
jgi:hypothetical protein